MYLVRSGNIYPPYQSLRDANHGSYLWASTTGTDSTFAYYLLFSNTTILPAYHSVRINGMPVRCIVRSGYVALNFSNVKNLSYVSTGWAGTAESYSSVDLANTYRIWIVASSVRPSDGPNSRWVGIPVRCLVY